MCKLDVALRRTVARRGLPLVARPVALLRLDVFFLYHQVVGKERDVEAGGSSIRDEGRSIKVCNTNVTYRPNAVMIGGRPLDPLRSEQWNSRSTVEAVQSSDTGGYACFANLNRLYCKSKRLRSRYNLLRFHYLAADTAATVARSILRRYVRLQDTVTERQNLPRHKRERASGKPLKYVLSPDERVK